MAKNANPNFHFFQGRWERASAGVKVSEVLDPYMQRQGNVPSLIVGPQMRRKTDTPVKWAKVIPPGMKDLPQYDRPRGGDDDRIMRGSIVNVQDGGEQRSFLVSHSDEKAHYILVRTGLITHSGDGGMRDRLNIQKDKTLVSHGSYSFDLASIRIAAADNEDKIKDIVSDPSLKFGTVAAERMDVKVIGKRIPLMGGGYCPQASYVLWRMPFGAILLIRDVDGKLTRLVSQKDQLRVVDAVGYAGFFSQLEEAYINLRRKEAEARKTTAAAKAASA